MPGKFDSGEVPLADGLQKFVLAHVHVVNCTTRPPRTGRRRRCTAGTSRLCQHQMERKRRRERTPESERERKRLGQSNDSAFIQSLTRRLKTYGLPAGVRCGPTHQTLQASAANSSKGKGFLGDLTTANPKHNFIAYPRKVGHGADTKAPPALLLSTAKCSESRSREGLSLLPQVHLRLVFRRPRPPNANGIKCHTTLGLPHYITLAEK